MAVAALQAQGLAKRYGACVANRDVSLEVAAGSIHALVGENGAGKSTLCKMLFGLVRPDTGQIFRDGRPIKLANARDAMAAGIGMVHQHFMLVDGLTVAENVMLGAEPVVGLALDRRRAQDVVAALSARFGLEVDPSARVENLPLGVLQRVEILKALHRGAKVLLLDEPTAVLTPQEVSALLDVLRRLRDEGRALVLVTHKLPEVMAVSDTVTVLRGGATVGVRQTAHTSAAELTMMMVGRDVDLSRKPRGPVEGAPRLTVSKLGYTDSDGVERLKDITLTVRAGEIVGIAGVEGNGQAQLVDALVGVLPAPGAHIQLDGQSLEGLDVRARRNAGLAHIPEDRLGQGLLAEFSVQDNAVLGWHHAPPFDRNGWRVTAAAQQRAADIIGAFEVRPPNAAAAVGGLSGGNQQKVLVGRELLANPKALVVAQPTRGVDVGAMERIHAAIRQAASNGVAVLLLSAELSELLALCDVIHVLYRGRLVHTVEGARASAEVLGPSMLGGGVVA